MREKMSSKNKRLNDIAQEQGSSSWLTVLPIKQFRFSLSKAEFFDAVYLWYGSTKTTSKSLWFSESLQSPACIIVKKMTICDFKE